MQLVSNRFGNFALDGEHIREITIVALCPLLGIGPSIDELRRYSDAIARSLNASFQEMCNPQLLTNLADVTRRSALVLHDAGATDHP